MLVARAPVRFSLGGGGSDLPAYARRFGGFVVSAAIDRSVYVCANPRFYRDIRLSYTRTEIVPSAANVEHPIFREALTMLGIERGIELVSVADLPGNTGLGSSGAFTVALLQALHAFKGEARTPGELAAEACTLEMERLGEPSGPQDPYIAAHGGICALTIHTDGAVEVEPLAVAAETVRALEDRLVVVYSGVERAARSVLAEQKRALETATRPVEAMHRIKEMGLEVKELLLRGELDRYGELLHAHWLEKQKQAAGMTDPKLSAVYALGRSAGATGGKLMGAGGGGFFLFYVPQARRAELCAAVDAAGLEVMRFRLGAPGVGLSRLGPEPG